MCTRIWRSGESHVPGVHGRGVVGAGAVVGARADVHDGAALLVARVLVAHDQPAQPVAGTHRAGTAQPHLLGVLVQFDGRENAAQVQLGDVVEHSQGQHQERQPGY